MLFMTDLVKLRALNLEAWSWSYLSTSTASKLLRGEGPAFRVLTALDLKYIQFPSLSALATLISAFVRLKTLAFDNVTWETSDDAMPLAPPFVSSLTKLHVVACSNEVLISWLFADALGDPIVKLKLRSLSLPDILPNEAGNIDRLVSSTSSSLEHLDVGFMGHSTDDAPVILKLAEKIDLSPHTQLCSLHVHQIVLYQFPGTPPHSSQSSPAVNLPTTWLASLLSTIRSAHFSRLTLSIWLGEERQLDSLDWDGFVRIVSNERFASLTQVEFRVRGLGKAMNDVVKGWISDRMSGWARVTECLQITFG
ncbi:unnamed protein product [Mycena citricolor]|nr:unnamed protein product [Mycena citricolor]